jgi:hypothetical protein
MADDPTRAEDLLVLPKPKILTQTMSRTYDRLRLLL